MKRNKILLAALLLGLCLTGCQKEKLVSYHSLRQKTESGEDVKMKKDMGQPVEETTKAEPEKASSQEPASKRESAKESPAASSTVSNEEEPVKESESSQVEKSSHLETGQENGVQEGQSLKLDHAIAPLSKTSEDAKVLYEIPAGETFTINQVYDDGWVRIDYQGFYGYLPAGRIK